MTDGQPDADAPASRSNGYQHVDLPPVLGIGHTAEREKSILPIGRAVVVGHQLMLRIFQHCDDDEFHGLHGAITGVKVWPWGR